MKIFKALLKTAAHKANRNRFQKQKEQAQREAFAEVGHQIRNAKRKGTYINVSAAYRNRYNRKIRKAKNQRDDLDYFLNNL